MRCSAITSYSNFIIFVVGVMAQVRLHEAPPLMPWTGDAPPMVLIDIAMDKDECAKRALGSL